MRLQKLFKDTIVLYHGSPHRLVRLEPQRGAEYSEYAGHAVSYVTPNRAYAAPYALAPSSGKNPIHVVDRATYPGRARNEGYMHRIVLTEGDPLPHAPDHYAPPGAADPSYFRAGKRYTWAELKAISRMGKKDRAQNSYELVFDEPVDITNARKISKAEVKSYGIKIRSSNIKRPYYYRVVNGKRIRCRNPNYK